MEIPIEVEGFGSRRVAVKTAGLFSGPKLLLDGAPVKQEQGHCMLRDNSGNMVEARIKPHLIDPIPRVEIGGRVVELARPLRWYEYTWMGCPIVLLFIGGLLGAVCGVVAVYTNARIFRGQTHPFLRYVFSGLISLVAVIVFLVLVILLQSMVQRPA